MAARKANADVIRLLNEVLTAELTAINQYVVHAKMCANWGYARLHKKLWKESIEEMEHAEHLIDRVLFLNGVPNVQRLGKINIGETVLEQLKLDTALEEEAIPRLNEGIELCRQAGDNGSRLLLEEILKGEEEHIDWLEAQLEQIEQVGIQGYLAEQIRDGEA